MRNDLDAQTVRQPNIFVYMPHLGEHPEGLTANVVLGQGRRGGNEHPVITPCFVHVHI